MPLSLVYLDENVDLGLVATLQRRGFHASHAVLEGTQYFTDAGQITYASVHGWMILSNNIAHFRMWHRRFHERGWSHGGIILLPTSVTLERLTLRAALLLRWIEATVPDPQSRLFTWSRLQNELTQGARLSGFTEDEVRIALGQRTL